MLFKADPYVPFTLSEELCRLVQFDVASDKHRPRVSSAKRCHALDHGNCLEAQFLESGFGIDEQSLFGISFSDRAANKIAKRFAKLRYLAILDSQTCGSRMPTAAFQVLTASNKSAMQIDHSG
jgi:hypothetical protein